MEGAAEGPQEGGILLKSGLLRRLHHRHAGADQLPGPQQPLLADVLVDRVAGDGLEPVHQIVPADEKPLGEGLHRQLLSQMVQNVPEHLLHLGVHPVAVPLLLGGAGAQHIPVHVDQHLLAEGIRHAGGAEAPVPQGLLQLLDALHIVEPPLCVEAQQVEPPLPGGVEAGVQRLAGVAAPLQPLPSQPDHHPLIGLRRVDDGPVDQVVSHQQQVPGLKEVGDALHHIGDLSPQEKDQLVKGVVVIVHLLGPAVLQVEQPEVLL